MSGQEFLGRFHDYGKAQELAKSIYLYAKIWRADGPIPACTELEFSNFLGAVGKAILGPGMTNLFYFLACTNSGEVKGRMLDKLFRSRVWYEQLDEDVLRPYHEKEAAVPPGTRKEVALEDLSRLCPDEITDEEPAEVETLNLGEVQTESVDWLVPGLIARGEMSTMGADGGTGKGIYYSQLIAAVTTGKKNDFFPDPPKAPGKVLILSGEDDPRKVLRPRLLAAGADLSNVEVVTSESYYSKKGALLTIDSESLRLKIEKMKPDGIFLSNGPGDPEDVTPVIELVRELRGRYPIFGICLGHQMISLAYGARTYKLKFGHRGGNHPVKNLETGKLEITSQNHSYAVDEESLAGTGLEVTHINLLDGTVEGVESKKDRVFSVQYHPESAPGPQDSTYLFDKFINMMKENADA